MKRLYFVKLLQKLGMILENKVFEKLKQSKNAYNKKKVRKIWMILDYWDRKLTLEIKFWSFLTNSSENDPPSKKFHNRNDATKCLGLKENPINRKNEMALGERRENSIRNIFGTGHRTLWLKWHNFVQLLCVVFLITSSW